MIGKGSYRCCSITPKVGWAEYHRLNPDPSLSQNKLKLTVTLLASIWGHMASPDWLHTSENFHWFKRLKSKHIWTGNNLQKGRSLCEQEEAQTANLPVPVPQATCTEKRQPQRSCSSWTPAAPPPGTAWPRCFYISTKITSCRSCTPLKTKACFPSPITHPCMAAFAFQGFCMEGRGALQSSCWLHLQLVKIRDSQMVSHQLFCSWPQWRQLGETNAPTTLITESSMEKRNRAPQSRTPTHCWKKK